MRRLLPATGYCHATYAHYESGVATVFVIRDYFDGAANTKTAPKRLYSVSNPEPSAVLRWVSKHVYRMSSGARGELYIFAPPGVEYDPARLGKVVKSRAEIIPGTRFQINVST